MGSGRSSAPSTTKGHGVGSAASRKKTREAGEGPVALCKALGRIVLAAGRFSLSAKHGAAVVTARGNLARVAFLERTARVRLACATGNRALLAQLVSMCTGESA